MIKRKGEKKMTKKYSVGGDVDAWCLKCKMELSHTITAIVDELPKKVKCNTCSGLHVYRLKPVKKSASAAKKTTRKRKPKISDLEIYESRLAGFDLAKATKYTMEGSFAQDEIIDHPYFGPGIVISVFSSKKIEILFKDGLKMLVQNY